MWPFTEKDPQRFVSRRFEKILYKAVKHLEASPKQLFTNQEDIEGNGVYAIYYDGAYEMYDWLVDETGAPIYIGKAVPKGWRSSRREQTASYNLQKRLSEHAKSITQATNLWLPNFSYKYVILDADLIASVEAEAIRQLQPLWNQALEGFGNHNVGRNRLGQVKSDWDVLHPGRPWADRMNGREREAVVRRVTERLVG